MQDHFDEHDSSQRPTITTSLMAAKAPAKPILYIRRWIILLLFSLVSMMNACTWITFSPFASKAATFYGVNSLAIDMFSLCFMIAYIPAIFLSSHLIAKYGLRFGMISAGILNTVGVWVRYGGTVPSTPIYAVVLIGQILCAAAQAFILQVPPLIANEYAMSNYERTFATSVGADFNQLGVAIGFLMGAFMVKDTSDIKLLMLAQAIATTVPAVLAAIFVRDRPPTPPSYSASQKAQASTEEQRGFIENLKMLVLNRSYVILWINFGLIIGAFYAVSTVLPLLLENYRYSSNDGGFLGFILTVVGIAGAIVVGILCDRTHRYKEILIGVNVGNMASFIWLAFIVKPDNYAHLAVNQSVLGLFITGALPAYLEASAEMSYPHVSEDFAAGMLIMGAQVFGIILTFVMSHLIQSNLHVGALWLAVGVTGVTVLLGFFVSPKYRRLTAEKAASQMISEGHIISRNDSVSATVAVCHDNIHLEIDEPPHRIFVAQPVEEVHKHRHHHHKHKHHGESHREELHHGHRHTQSASPHEHDSTLQDLEDPHHEQNNDQHGNHRHKKHHHHHHNHHPHDGHKKKRHDSEHQDDHPRRGLHDAITM